MTCSNIFADSPNSQHTCIHKYFTYISTCIKSRTINLILISICAHSPSLVLALAHSRYSHIVVAATCNDFVITLPLSFCFMLSCTQLHIASVGIVAADNTMQSPSTIAIAIYFCLQNTECQVVSFSFLSSYFLESGRERERARDRREMHLLTPGFR